MGNPEKLQALKSRIAANPFDSIAWEQLLGEISKGRKTDDQDAQLREVYEDLLGKFPTAVSVRRIIPCENTNEHDVLGVSRV
jgi:hypothetical protein